MGNILMSPFSLGSVAILRLFFQCNYLAFVAVVFFLDPLHASKALLLSAIHIDLFLLDT